MIRIAYTSTATFPFQDGDLISLLMTSRLNNKRDGVTGLLLHDDGHFLQILEGEEDAVDAKLARISADPRHASVSVVWRQEIDDRQFAKWTMGYTTLSDPLIGLIPGYDKFFDSDPVVAATPLQALLEAFREDPSLSLASSVAND